jgi:hypothetical protein
MPFTAGRNEKFTLRMCVRKKISAYDGSMGAGK